MIFSIPWPRNIEVAGIEHRNRGLDIGLFGLTPAEFNCLQKNPGEEYKNDECDPVEGAYPGGVMFYPDLGKMTTYRP